jgi:hypothetical protein
MVNVDARTGKLLLFHLRNELMTRFQNLIDLCVEICLPPLSLVDGKCLKLDLGIASDLTNGLGLGEPTDLVHGLTGGLLGGDPLGGNDLPVGGLLGGDDGLGGLGLL